jgi:hypothetical protein
MTFRFFAAPVLLAGAVALAGASVVHADDDCQKRTMKADHNLHEAIQKHGPASPEAEHWRSELAAARSFCWEHEHKWWDEDGNRWRSDKDWDMHDHDH